MLCYYSFHFFFVVFFSFVIHYVGGWVGGSVVQFGLMFDTSLLVRHTVDLEAWGMFYSFFVFFLLLLFQSLLSWLLNQCHTLLCIPVRSSKPRPDG